MMWPGWWWFVTPSGGPVRPGLWGWLDGIKRRPLVAHPVGAAIVVWAFRSVLGSDAVSALAAAVLAESVNQYYKAVRGIYGTELWVNVVYRILLAAAGGGAVLLLY